MSGLRARWLDSGREPQLPPDPNYPDGIDLDASNGAIVTCQMRLDYPAPRCGAYVIECRDCGATVAVTTAGRRDDPRSIKVACRRPAQAPAPPSPRR